MLTTPRLNQQNRSPEEVDRTWLNEQIDVFSVCNIFYSILTGREVWLDPDANVLQQVRVGIHVKCVSR